MKRITVSSGKQAQSIEEVNSAVTEMDQVVRSNAAGAEESASASEQMSVQAEQLKSLVKGLAALAGDAANPGLQPSHAADQIRMTTTGLPGRLNTLRERLIARLLTFGRDRAEVESIEKEF